MRFVILMVSLLPSLAFAEPMTRPIPNPQSATAEFWFFMASLAFVAALYAVHHLVRRR